MDEPMDEPTTLDREERERYFRLVYTNGIIKNLVDTFYVFEQNKGFICQKCDAVRSTFKHEKDCFIGKLDNILTYADNPSLNPTS